MWRPKGIVAGFRRCAGHDVITLSPQHGLDARHELARVERLGQVIVGAHLETDDAVDVLALRGQHDDGHRFARRAQAAAYREPVLAGQHEVEDHEARRIALQLAVEVARIGQRGHLEPLLAQVTREKIAQPDIVVDDEDLDGAVACCHVVFNEDAGATRTRNCKRL